MENIGKRISFAGQTGTIIELHLKANKASFRKNDIYRVKYDNGKYGLLELTDRGITFLN